MKAPFFQSVAGGSPEFLLTAQSANRQHRKELAVTLPAVPLLVGGASLLPVVKPELGAWEARVPVGNPTLAQKAWKVVRQSLLAGCPQHSIRKCKPPETGRS